MKQELPTITKESFDAVLFDLDGVITQTAKVHAKCWQTMFDAFLQARADANDQPFRAFDPIEDYRLYVDGKPRYEGVQGFLDSRMIQLPYGDITDSEDQDTVCGLGNRKDRLVKEAIRRGDVETYGTTVALINQLRERGVQTAVVSSSRNCEEILSSVGIEDLFAVRVDGVIAAEQKIPGKPKPDTFLKAAELLNVPPSRTVVVEDAIVGVQAGKAGEFGLVIGVDRVGHADALRDNGAHVVVQDLGEFLE